MTAIDASLIDAPVADLHELVIFQKRRIALLERTVREKDDLLTDAVVCLHEAGDHQAADRIERLAEAF